jgi:hypothetical protein
MAICQYCEQDMCTADTCIQVPFPNAPNVSPVRYGQECTLDEDPWYPAHHGTRCHDCGVAPGGFHHPRCNVERHPVTGQQALFLREDSDQFSRVH